MRREGSCSSIPALRPNDGHGVRGWSRNQSRSVSSHTSPIRQLMENVVRAAAGVSSGPSRTPTANCGPVAPRSSTSHGDAAASDWREDYNGRVARDASSRAGTMRALVRVQEAGDARGMIER